MSRDRFKEALGRTSFRVVHEVGGKEVDETEVLRGATEHATAYPCEIREDPGALLEKILRVYDSEAEALWKDLHEPTEVKFARQLSGSAPPPTGGDQERYPPNEDDSGKRGKAELLAIGVDVAKDPDHFVVTIVCPCGSRASISSRTMSPAELVFVADWSVAHDGHAKGAGH